MYTINIYKDLDRLELSMRDIKIYELTNVLKRLEETISSCANKWYKKDGDSILFRIEVVDQKDLDIRNIIWKSKQGYLESCSIEKYIRHLLRKLQQYLPFTVLKPSNSSIDLHRYIRR